MAPFPLLPCVTGPLWQGRSPKVDAVRTARPCGPRRDAGRTRCEVRHHVDTSGRRQPMADEPTTSGLTRLAAAAAVGVGALSLVYAVCYLFVAPSAQRGADVDAYFTSYLANPTGLRVASFCLFVSGVLTTLVYAALHGTDGRLPRTWRTWALALGTAAGVATSAHGL